MYEHIIIAALPRFFTSSDKTASTPVPEDETSRVLLRSPHMPGIRERSSTVAFLIGGDTNESDEQHSGRCDQAAIHNGSVLVKEKVAKEIVVITALALASGVEVHRPPKRLEAKLSEMGALEVYKKIHQMWYIRVQLALPIGNFLKLVREVDTARYERQATPRNQVGWVRDKTPSVILVTQRRTPHRHHIFITHGGNSLAVVARVPTVDRLCTI
ncbi:hypothetical protein K440DRAFT_637460 [Wilcoxina mikolae CBS 423.85]|nr:hypothetical protein K440DRAFT_637460 [Wilcoxina mikolae CBS 423.85]